MTYTAAITLSTFADLFFSQNLHQQFNKKGLPFSANENESALARYMRANSVTNVKGFPV